MNAHFSQSTTSACVISCLAVSFPSISLYMVSLRLAYWGYRATLHKFNLLQAGINFPGKRVCRPKILR